MVQSEKSPFTAVRTARTVLITEKNAFDFQQLVTDIVEDAAELPENPTEKKDKD